MGAVCLWKAFRVSWTLCVLCCANVPLSVGFASVCQLGFHHPRRGLRISKRDPGALGCLSRYRRTLVGANRQRL